MSIEFERGYRPPTKWLRDDKRIVETWRVYDADTDRTIVFVSPLHGEEVTAAQAIDEIMRQYVGDWPEASAELIRWAALLPWQYEYLEGGVA